MFPPATHPLAAGGGGASGGGGAGGDRPMTNRVITLWYR